MHTSANMQDVCVAGQLTRVPITKRTTPGPHAQPEDLERPHQIVFLQDAGKYTDALPVGILHDVALM